MTFHEFSNSNSIITVNSPKILFATLSQTIFAPSLMKAVKHIVIVCPTKGLIEMEFSSRTFTTHLHIPGDKLRHYFNAPEKASWRTGNPPFTFGNNGFHTAPELPTRRFVLTLAKTRRAGTPAPGLAPGQTKDDLRP